MAYDREDSPFIEYGGTDELTPTELLMRLNALQSRIASTISEVRREDNAIKEKQSQIVQEVDLISLEVFEIDTISGDKTSRVSRLELRADEISSEVFYTDEFGVIKSRIQQQAGQIEQRVSISDYNGNEIASRLNQTATTITLDAQMIDLLGITTVAQNLRLGEEEDGLTKRLTFSNGASIYNESTALTKTYLHVDAERFYMEADDIFVGYFSGSTNTYFYGDVDFSSANVTGLPVPDGSHSHVGEYVGSQNVQSLSLAVTSTGELQIFISGAYRGAIDIPNFS
jgi:hypothetical protein